MSNGKGLAYAAGALAALLLVAAFVSAITGIWLSDDRWGGTAAVCFLTSVLVGAAAMVFHDPSA